MKTKHYLFSLAMTGFFALGCENQYDAIEDLNLEEVSMVDPDTPEDAQPYILEDDTENGRIMAPPGNGWTQVFSDEFNYTAEVPNTDKWTENVSNSSRSLNSRHSSLNWWGWKTGRVRVRNGNLELSSKKMDASTLYCGSVFSKNKYTFKYGYAEARIKIQHPQHASHTAFWLQGANQGNVNGTGSDGAEIDIFESAWTDNTTKSVVHIDGYGSSKQSQTKKWDANGLNSGYHLFGLHWTADYLRIYYDGNRKVEYGGQKWIPDVEEWLWLSCGAAFDVNAANSGARNFPTRTIGSVQISYVDWIRVWQ